MSNRAERPGHLYDRHPDTVHLLRMLFPNPNLPDDLYGIAVRFHEHAVMAVGEVEDGPELTAGLRKLLEAKDCFVRAALPADSERNTQP